MRNPAGQDQEIREKYKEIKVRNERLKLQNYAEYLKMAPTNQTRLMPTFDVKEGKMQITFLKSTTQQPRSVVNYQRIDFEVQAKDIHHIDQIEIHK